MLIACASFAGQFAYISDSPFVLIEGYGVPETQFGYYFATTALALMAGSLAGGRMLRAGSTPHRMLVLGTAILAVGGVLVVIGTRIDGLGTTGFMAPMIVYFVGIGITSPNATALALEPVPEIAGTASSALGFSTMISGAIAGYATTKIGGSSPETFAIVVLVMGVLAFALAASRRQVRSRRSD
jgi:DHA1 family bicyclomycin/chloramphenicol resistance-like MFS transporter